MRAPKILSLATVLMVASVQAGERDDTAVAGCGFFLNEVQLQESKALAKEGDVRAMWNIYFHYAYAADNTVKGLEWLERAGDAGDMEARYDTICGYTFAGTEEQQATMIPELAARWGIPPECLSQRARNAR